MAKQLGDDTRDYWVSGQVPRLHRPSSIDFMRQYMSYHPFIVTGVVDQWKAYKEWDMLSIGETIGMESLVPITLTPDGLADCIKPAHIPTDSSEGTKYQT